MPLLVAPAAAAELLSPERHVDGHRLISDRDPHIVIEVPAALAYYGADRFKLYGVADCEIHAFAEKDGDGRVERMLWLQFEAYLPQKPELRYDYPPAKHIRSQGMDFLLSSYVMAGRDTGKPGGDREHFVALLGAHGARLPDAMMYVRLVHLLDARRELMIIYGEPAPGDAAGRSDWADGLTARAIEALRLSQ